MKSRFKHLVVSGCSFTTNEHVPDGSDWNWANILCKDTGMTIHNLATAGAGNDHISRSIILYLEQNKLPVEETLVMAMWSGVGRIDWITAPDIMEQGKWMYYYTPQCQLTQGGNWWNIKHSSLIFQAVKNYAKFQNNYTFALQSWLAMKSLSTYLDCYGYKYFYTSFVNYKNNQIKGDALTIPFDDSLNEIGLQCDYFHWLPLAAEDYFGDWCRERKLLVSDNFHPGLDGPQRWPREVLIPLLLELGILEQQ